MYFFPYQEYQLITETKQEKLHASSFYIHQHANLVIFNKLERTSWACHCTYQNFGDLLTKIDFCFTFLAIITKIRVLMHQTVKKKIYFLYKTNLAYVLLRFETNSKPKRDVFHQDGLWSLNSHRIICREKDNSTYSKTL